ncbi:MAG: hypothetical protein ACFCUI_11985 [Bernardetiaceae bacterium]
MTRFLGVLAGLSIVPVFLFWVYLLTLAIWPDTPKVILPVLVMGVWVLAAGGYLLQTRSRVKTARGDALHIMDAELMQKPLQKKNLLMQICGYTNYVLTSLMSGVIMYAAWRDFVAGPPSLSNKISLAVAVVVALLFWIVHISYVYRTIRR